MKMFKPLSETNLLTAHIFVLRDATKGFELENRRELRSFAYMTQNDVYAAHSKQNEFWAEPMMPLRMWDDSKTFYENYRNRQHEVHALCTESNIPKRLLRQDFSSMTPLELAMFYQQQGISALQHDFEAASSNDPDSQYFVFTGPDFVDWQQRRELESKDPYVYLSYTLSRVIGCEHYARDAFPVCPICDKVYPCRFCHNEQEDDHELPRSSITEMQCQRCGKRGPIGNVCQHCYSVVSVICCPICHTLCLIGPEMKPAYHCDKCGVCRVGLADTSVHCDKCKTCFDKEMFSSHQCTDPAVCMICQQDLQETIVAEFSLKCNQQHRMHTACYEELLKNGQYTCPLDHKVIIDDTQYGMLRAKVLSQYRQQVVFYVKPTDLVACIKYRCYDCETYAIDFSFDALMPICHGCFGINCRECCRFAVVADATTAGAAQMNGNVLSDEYLDARRKISHEDQDNEEDVVFYLRCFRLKYSELVPKVLKYDQALRTVISAFAGLLAPERK